MPEELKTSNFKFQTSVKLQFPTFASRPGGNGEAAARQTVARAGVLRFGAWSFSEVWSLKFGVSGIALVWLSIVVTGLALAAWYTGSPGVSATAPELWPSESRIPLDPSRATLVMFAHPRCPCTRASLSELDRLLARCPVQINVQVVFLKPAGMNEDWVKTSFSPRA